MLTQGVIEPDDRIQLFCEDLEVVPGLHLHIDVAAERSRLHAGGRHIRTGRRDGQHDLQL